MSITKYEYLSPYLFGDRYILAESKIRAGMKRHYKGQFKYERCELHKHILKMVLHYVFRFLRNI